MPTLARDDLRWGLLVVGIAASAGLLVAVASSATSPVLGPGLALLGALVVAAWHNPVWGLAAAGLALPLELVGLPLPSGALSPAEGVFALVAVLYLARAALRPRSVTAPSLRDWPIWLLLVVIGAGVAVANDPAPSLRIVVMWTLFYLVYLQAQSLTTREMRTVIGGLAIGAGILGGMGAVTYLQSSATQLFAGGLYTSTRATGTFVDANYYASMLALVAVPAAAVALHAPRRSWWIGAGAATAAMGVVFSLSRGGVIALGGGLLLLLLWGRARWLVLAMVSISAALTIANANPLTSSSQFQTVSARLATLGSSNLQSTNRRPAIWRAAIEAGVDRPLLGLGAHGFQQRAAQSIVFEQGSGIENTHNMYLSFLAEQGFTGFLAFIALLVGLAIRAGPALRGSAGLEYAIALGIAGAFAGFALQGLTQMQLRVNVIAAGFFLLAGMLTALSDRAARRG